jgi:outer membrane autotransporter protein
VATATHDGRDYTIVAGGGYNAAVGSWNLIPTLSLQYGYHTEDDFTESGAGAMNLSIDSMNSYSLLSKAGFRLNKEFIINNVPVLPEISAQWGHEFGDTESQTSSRFAGTTTGIFTVPGQDAGRDSAILGVGLSVYLTDDVTASLSYETEFRENFNAHNLQVGLRFAF